MGLATYNAVSVDIFKLCLGSLTNPILCRYCSSTSSIPKCNKISEDCIFSLKSKFSGVCGF